MQVKTQNKQCNSQRKRKITHQIRIRVHRLHLVIFGENGQRRDTRVYGRVICSGKETRQEALRGLLRAVNVGGANPDFRCV